MVLKVSGRVEMSFETISWQNINKLPLEPGLCEERSGNFIRPGFSGVKYIL